MISPEAHFALMAAILGAGLAAAIALLWTSAPYGRHGRQGWGPTLPGRLGWMVMESPAVLLVGWLFAQGPHSGDPAPRVLLGLWMLHYVHRTFIFPFRLHSTKPMPILVAALAFGFQTAAAFMTAPWLSELGHYPASWLRDPRFLLGAALFLGGWVGNLHADTVLMRLRRPGDTGYHIPRGGLFRWVTSANYFAELVMWAGWAVATWSAAGLTFFLFCVANLAPRAAQHHRWYLAHFGAQYPAERRRLLPFLW